MFSNSFKNLEKTHDVLYHPGIARVIYFRGKNFAYYVEEIKKACHQRSNYVKVNLVIESKVKLLWSTHLRPMSISMRHWKKLQDLRFSGRFQGVYKWNIDVKWVKITQAFDRLALDSKGPSDDYR